MTVGSAAVVMIEISGVRPREAAEPVNRSKKMFECRVIPSVNHSGNELILERRFL